jgi:hypothetical protein
LTALGVLTLLASLEAPSASSAAPAVTTVADLVTTISPVRANAPPNPPGRPYSTALFVVTVKNNGPNTAHNVTVNNAVGFAALGGLTATPSTVVCALSTGICTKPWLRSGHSITVTVTVHYKEFIHNMLFDDTATATSTTSDPNTTNNSATGIYVII